MATISHFQGTITNGNLPTSSHTNVMSNISITMPTREIPSEKIGDELVLSEVHSQYSALQLFVWGNIQVYNASGPNGNHNRRGNGGHWTQFHFRFNSDKYGHGTTFIIRQMKSQIDPTQNTEDVPMSGIPGPQRTSGVAIATTNESGHLMTTSILLSLTRGSEGTNAISSTVPNTPSSVSSGAGISTHYSEISWPCTAVVSGLIAVILS
ncbi:hypothetical protein BDZ94DRAFT_1241089 [Collybia nuda]|uniref:Uncharacterized protein n=1 Tax=Collybia nuda TaxID=64659 RepID=A0A9P5XUW8_9AGAR|nr:hypothetical protein BDZ94DRAFT_1241089 [Collybia nuda]